MSIHAYPVPDTDFTVLRLPGRCPEDVLLDAEGRILCGLEDGSIVRSNGEGAEFQVVANTGGRPLGLDWLPDGRLVVCDAERGLLAVDLSRGEVQVLTTAAHGEPILVCNNPCVSRAGAIYFSDSSRRNKLAAIDVDVIERQPTGRLLRRNPNGSVDVLLEGLHFANGVVLAPDESFVLVAETGGACIKRLWLTGSKKGHSETFAAQLPGLPDNMSLGSDGLFWVAIPAPMDKPLQVVHRLPAAARLAISRMGPLLPKPARRALAMAFNAAGECVRFLEANPLRYHLITGVRERGGLLYVSSIEENALGIMRIPAATRAASRASATAVA